MTSNELIAYAREQYGTEPEYLWESAPNTFVLRHRGNRKWYAVVMDVRRDRLGLAGEEIVYIMDVKCGPLLGGSYIGKPGVVPAYHMNKTHWLGVLLDGSAADKTVTELLDLSYSETQSRKRLRGDTRGTTDQNGFGEKRAVRSGFEGGDHGE